MIPFDTPNGSIQYCRNGSAAAGKWEKVEDRKRGEKRERERERERGREGEREREKRKWNDNGADELLPA